MFALAARQISARHVVLPLKSTMKRALALQIPRSFNVSLAAHARAAATAARAKPKKTTTKKRPSARATKKSPVKNKKVKKVVSKPKKEQEKISPRELSKYKFTRPTASPFTRFYAKMFREAKPLGDEKHHDLIKRTMKEAAAAWKALPEDEKQVYREQQNARNLELREEMNEFVKNTDHAVLRAINKRRVAKNKKRIRFRLGPDSRKPTGYTIFFGEQRSNTTFPSVQASRTAAGDIGRKWSAMPESEKALYHERAQAAAAAMQRA